MTARARALVLASRSPQRRAILQQLGVQFSVVVPEVEELEDGPPDLIALENARRKARAVAGAAAVAGTGAVAGAGAAAEAGAGAHAGWSVLAVDTVVFAAGKLYGKPADEAAARATLAALSDRRHAVVGGLCLIENGAERTAVATTIVEFRALTDALIDWYLRSGEWRDRAGGYAIQGRGAALVSRIDGDYLNVVGLPVGTLLELAPDLIAVG